jgi:hypothetical protein
MAAISPSADVRRRRDWHAIVLPTAAPSHRPGQSPEHPTASFVGSSNMGETPSFF